MNNTKLSEMYLNTISFMFIKITFWLVDVVCSFCDLEVVLYCFLLMKELTKNKTRRKKHTQCLLWEDNDWCFFFFNYILFILFVQITYFLVYVWNFIFEESKSKLFIKIIFQNFTVWKLNSKLIQEIRTICINKRHIILLEEKI